MDKKSIMISMEREKLDALEVFLKKENTSVQKRMGEALSQLYEKTVPEPVREFVEAKAGQKPKRSGISSHAKEKAPIASKPETTGNKGEHCERTRNLSMDR